MALGGRQRAIFHDVEARVVAQTADEEHALRGPSPIKLVIRVPAIVHNDGSRCKTELPSHGHVMNLAVRDHPEGRQIAVVIEHKMQLDGTFGATELCPIEHRQAKIDGRRIDAHQFVLEAKLALARHLGSNLLKQTIKHLLEQLPWSMLIGVRKRRAHRCFDSKVRELPLATLQATFDLAKRVDAAKLAKQHRYELRPARLSLARVLGTRLLHDAFEFNPRNQLEYLAEHAA